MFFITNTVVSLDLMEWREESTHKQLSVCSFPLQLQSRSVLFLPILPMENSLCLVISPKQVLDTRHIVCYLRATLFTVFNFNFNVIATYG